MTKLKIMRPVYSAIVVLIFSLLFVSQAHARNIVQEMTNHINESRFAIGQQQLHYDSRLRNAAFYHAKDMADRNYFSHYTPEGWSVQTRVQGWGWPSWAPVGEVIACGSGDPWVAFQQWMNSGGHRAILHNGSYNAIGVAHYHNPNSSCRDYWVAVVGRR